MNDLISRRATIDAFDTHADEIIISGEENARNVLNYLNKVIDTIKALPSAQPEKRTQERTETHACDLISRAMLLEYIHNEPVGKMLCDKYNLDGVIKQLPSAQPEIIRCKDCKWYGRADKRRFYRGTDCLNHRIDTIVPDKDYCSRAERRTDE